MLPVVPSNQLVSARAGGGREGGANSSLTRIVLSEVSSKLTY